MPSKKEIRKILDKVSRNVHLDIYSSIPMSIDQLEDLFGFLNREHLPDCDGTLKHTIEYIEKLNLDLKLIIPWLNQYGGHCDCEVVSNVYEEMSGIIE